MRIYIYVYVCIWYVYVCIYIPQNAVRMGFLQVARELNRDARGRFRKRPGAQFVPERKNTIKLMLFCPRAQKHCAPNAFFCPRAQKHYRTKAFLSPSTTAL